MTNFKQESFLISISYFQVKMPIQNKVLDIHNILIQTEIIRILQES